MSLHYSYLHACTLTTDAIIKSIHVKDLCVARFLHIGTIEGTTLAKINLELSIDLESILS